MRRDRRLGLDELMIVNPSSSGTEAMFLGEDGVLYQVQGFETDGSAECGEVAGEISGEDDVGRLGQYFLGADGSLYEVVRGSDYYDVTKNKRS